MLKKDKEKVFGGDWTEDQLRDFLTAESYDGCDQDYLAVIRAYRHMLPETFEAYIALYKAEGHNLEAKNTQGETLFDTMNGHIQGKEYADILKAANV